MYVFIYFFCTHPLGRSALRKLLYEPRARVDTVKRGLFVRAPKLVNTFLRKVPEADFFADTAGSFKAHVLKYIK